MKNTSLYQLYRLLRPEVRPRVGMLALVAVLATVTAFGVKAPLMLLQPLWNTVLFPEASVSEPASALPGAERLDLIESEPQQAALRAFESTRQAVAETLYGAQLGENELRLSALWTVAFLMAVLTVLAGVAMYFQILLARWVALRMVIDLRVRLARHLVALSMHYHGQRRFGDLLSRISADVNKTLQVANLCLRDLIQQPLMVLASIAVAAYAALWPTVVFVLILPAAAAPIALLGKRVRKRSKKSLDKLGDSIEILTQIFTGIRTVKAFRAEERELDRYRAVNEGYLSSSMKMVRAVATIRSSSHMFSYLGFTGLILLVGWVSIEHPLFGEGGEMVVFFAAIGMIYQHTRRITSAFNKIQESAGAADRLLELLEEPADIVDAPDAAVAHGLGAGVRFEGVSFAYPEGEGQALSELDLELVPGETLAVVGPSGAGKSTLVDLIARFIDPTTGRITVDGVDLRQLTLDSWTGTYALVGQTPFLFHDSILENIRYGKPDASEAEIHAAAAAAQIHEFIESLPEGYATRVGDEGSRLSGGQRQRITIARAILESAPLLLLDEATSSLDSESEAAVQRALDELMINRTVIVIAHRLSTIRNADRIAVLQDGRLVELGSHDELIARDGVYARLFATQYGVAAD